MKFSLSISILMLLCSCFNGDPSAKNETINLEWQQANIDWSSLETKGATYLSTYSQTFGHNEEVRISMTTSVFMRNLNLQDTVYISKADYYNTAGQVVEQYLEDVIAIKPMETLSIVINQDKNEGGTGSNFVFEWATQASVLEPQFEAVMLSTSGQQGISFTSQGIRIK